MSTESVLPKVTTHDRKGIYCRGGDSGTRAENHRVKLMGPELARRGTSSWARPSAGSKVKGPGSQKPFEADFFAL